jgi:hypothetical protein
MSESDSPVHTIWTRVGTRIVWDPSWHPGMIVPSAFADDDNE